MSSVPKTVTNSLYLYGTATQAGRLSYSVLPNPMLVINSIGTNGLDNLALMSVFPIGSHFFLKSDKGGFLLLRTAADPVIGVSGEVSYQCNQLLVSFPNPFLTNDCVVVEMNSLVSPRYIPKAMTKFATNAVLTLTTRNVWYPILTDIDYTFLSTNSRYAAPQFSDTATPAIIQYSGTTNQIFRLSANFSISSNNTGDDYQMCFYNQDNLPFTNTIKSIEFTSNNVFNTHHIEDMIELSPNMSVRVAFRNLDSNNRVFTIQNFNLILEGTEVT